MKRWKGRWLMAVAVVHTLFAAIAFTTSLTDIVTRGVIDTVGDDPMTGAVVWFVLFGVALFIVGLAVDLLESAPSAAPTPKSLGASIMTLTLLGIALMPTSGFWLAIPPSLALLWGPGHRS